MKIRAKIAEKIEILNFLRAHYIELEVIIYRDFNMGAFSYDVCSNLEGEGSKSLRWRVVSWRQQKKLEV